LHASNAGLVSACCAEPQNDVISGLKNVQTMKLPQEVVASITKAESHSTHSDLSAVKAEITTERFPHGLLFTAADAILVTCELVPVGVRGRWQ
jgi:hypothetical protein